MITDFELLMFTKHLRQLSYDYIKCEDQEIKEQIKDEILFFSEIVCSS